MFLNINILFKNVIQKIKLEKSEINISYIDNILPTNNELIFIVIDIIVFILCTLITISSFKSKSLNKRNNMNK